MVCVAPNDYRGYEALRELDDDNLSPVWGNILTLAPTSPIAYLRASEFYFISDEAIDLAMEGLSRYGDDEFGSLYRQLSFLLSRSDSGDEWVSSYKKRYASTLRTSSGHSSLRLYTRGHARLIQSKLSVAFRML